MINGSVLIPYIEPPTIPAVPLSLQAVTISTSRVDLSWTDSSNNEDGFVIERSIDGGAWTQIATAARNATTFSDQSVPSRASLLYRVASSNIAGASDWSNLAAASTMPPRVIGTAWNDANGNGTRDPAE